MNERLYNWLAPLAVVAMVAVVYGHTLHAPFYLDDQWAIIDKHLLRDLPATLQALFSQRGLTNLTLALNYRFSGLSLAPLHLTNIIMHAASGLLVWLVLRRLLAGPWLPLLGALLFVAHPLQTQAVTYLIQRAAVLGAFFFLLAFWCHLRARAALAAGASRAAPQFWRPYWGGVLAGACAVLAKENTATLPLVLYAYDRLFPMEGEEGGFRSLYGYLPYCVVPLLVAIITISAVSRSGGTAVLFVPLASTEHNGPLTYLVTQFSVFWVYLRLLFLPYGQALEHNYPVAAELFTVPSLFALTALLAAGWTVWRARRRLPLPAFGATWFMLALLVESSVIPLDPLFEHRLYLPLFGFVLIVLALLPTVIAEKWTLAVLGVAILVCAPLSWRRNALWNEPIALYEDNLRQVPGSERAMENLATLYGKAGRFAEERALLEKALQLFPKNPIVRDNLAKINAEENRWREAYALLEEGMRLQPAVADFYETAAAIAQRQGDIPRAAGYLQRGLTIAGADRERLWNDLGVLYSEAGDPLQAEAAFQQSLAANPESATTYLNLGKEYFVRSRWGDAIAALRKAADLDPGRAEILEGLGQSAVAGGEFALAREMADKLRTIDRAAWSRLQTTLQQSGAVRR